MRTSCPEGLQQGTPGKRSSQCGSSSACTIRVDPLSGSTARNSCPRWSRDCTRISGAPAPDQCTRARYGYRSRSHTTSVRTPSRVSTKSRTSAFRVPAAGYATRCGSRSGCAGSAIHQRLTGASSARATSSRSDSGDHQKPRDRSISSAAMNSASPYVTVSDSGSASARSRSPARSVRHRAPSATYATSRPSGEGRGSRTGPRAGISRTVPAGNSAAKSRPDKANAASSTAESVAYPTIPALPSRLRSRRARSSTDSFSSAPPSRVTGSAATRSPPSGRSSTHSLFARSVPEEDRR